ncbi:argonaute 2 [Calliopsis andreniformis]|uniref:argonaute 2 n=1 Tax=Calliopsis andreniformis TaxID=337506 RepID=UPI003FCE015C
MTKSKKGKQKKKQVDSTESGSQQQQQQPSGSQQQPSGSQQQQQQPSGSQQQQQQPSGSQQQQPGTQQQQPGPCGTPQQQPRSHGPPKQQHGPPGPSQQQPRPPGPPQQQFQPQGAWQQQRRPSGPPQQQRPSGPPQQQRPSDPPQQQHGPPGPPQQQRGPHGLVQQQFQPRGAWQQQQRRSDPPQQQHGPPGPPQQQRGQHGPVQQQFQPRGAWQQQQRPSGPPQQQLGPLGPPQQQPGPSGPPQQQPEPHRPPELPVQPQQTQSSGDQKQEQIQSVSSQISKKGIVQGVTSRGTLTTAFQAMYYEAIPKRKTGGKTGRPIMVETNMFRINLNTKFLKNVVHYDVVIDPDRPKFLMRPVFEEYRKLYFPSRHAAFDGKKNAYSASDLPFGAESPQSEVKVFDKERQTERTFKMHMKKVANLDLSCLITRQDNIIELQKCIQVLDIIFRHGPANSFTIVGRSLFPKPIPGKTVTLSSGLELWVGVFQSAVIGWRPYLNIDVAHKGFPKEQSVIDLMKELCVNPKSREQRLQHLRPDDIDRNADKITKFLKGLKVQYEIPGQPNTKRTYRVNGLAENARQSTFQTENGKCTVEDYFAQVKRCRLQFPEFPCLWVGSINSSRKIHLPVELCTIIAGQVIQRKMDENQTAEMIRHAATDTHRRKEKILDGFAKMNLNEQPTLMNEFHLSVQGEFEKVPARVLQAPRLKYDKREVNVVKGVWRAEKFLKSCHLPENTWTILNLDKFTQDRDLYDLQNKLQSGGKYVNMNIEKPLTPFTHTNVQRNLTNITEYFKEKKKQNIQLVVVIIPNLDTVYSTVKQISELQITGGIVTQCLKSRTLKKLSDATITNILLKINSKLNGINHTFSASVRPPCFEVPCMLVGADVTHPSPDAMNMPSIAAVAASHDLKAFQYNIELRLQSPREEMIQDLEEIMRKQLLFFYEKTGQKPLKIIFYRDGVSEGQLPQVMHFELNAIKNAIAKLEKSKTRNIRITFLVVQKRHHVRLFPTDSRNSDDRNFNVQAGTIVDTEITHPMHIDFYLVSHASIQGTARPTKYRCICNENELSEDEIEQLTYYLCHMFARCTRSVSYPAPTYYAHLAAFRARAWIQNVPLNIENLPEEQRRKMTVQMKNSPMFFV